MSGRDELRTIRSNVSEAISSAGVSQDSIAEAIGLSSFEMESRLERGDISLPQLSQVGGLLGVSGGSFFEGVA